MMLPLPLHPYLLPLLLHPYLHPYLNDSYGYKTPDNPPSSTLLTNINLIL